MSLFNKGYKAVAKEQERQEAIKESLGRRLNQFFLTAKDDEASVIFLTTEPITFKAYNVKKMSNSGKEYYDMVVCTNESKQTEKYGSKPSFKGAFLIYDTRPVNYTTQDGKEVNKDGQIRLYITGITNLPKLERCESKWGLADYVWEISRTGTGKAVSYSFDRGEKLEDSDYADKDFVAELPKALAEDFGDDFEALLEDQLMQYTENPPKHDSHTSTEDDEEEDGEDESLVNVEDEEEDEAPKKKSVVKKSVVSVIKKKKR
mgnify:CR=1 FL=1|jgi:hypothetical protein